MKSIIIKTISTLGGLGFLTAAPGTVTSVASTIIAWPIHYYGPPYSLALSALAIFLVGCWASEHYERLTGTSDAPEIVIDELTGLWFSLSFVPPDPLYFGIGLILFRLYDILKPWPINIVDRYVKGGFGVMLDDILAALYVNLTIAGFLILQRI